MQTHVTLERADDVGYLTLACEQPGKPPTLDLDVLDGMADGLAGAASSEGLRALVIRSGSPRYFCVGANVNALQTLNPESIVPWVRRGHAVLGMLEALPMPTLARVEGFALGGGLELAMACDLIVASHDARMGQPEARLGFVAGWGGSYRLPLRIGLARAKELFFTGQVIDAGRAMEIGLIDFLGDAAEIDAYLASFLQAVRQCSPLAIAEMKRLLNASPTWSPRDCVEEESVSSQACLSSGDTQARVAAFLETRRSRTT